MFFTLGLVFNVVSTLPNVVKFNDENDNFISRMFIIVQINVEIENDDSTLM